MFPFQVDSLFSMWNMVSFAVIKLCYETLAQWGDVYLKQFRRTIFSSRKIKQLVALVYMCIPAFMCSFIIAFTVLESTAMINLNKKFSHLICTREENKVQNPWNRSICKNFQLFPWFYFVLMFIVLSHQIFHIPANCSNFILY